MWKIKLMFSRVSSKIITLYILSVEFTEQLTHENDVWLFLYLGNDKSLLKKEMVKRINAYEIALIN